MLLNKLYSVSSFDCSETGDAITACISLVKDHPVFAGHFPGNPVLPGVCTIQIIGELLEKALRRKLMLTRASTIKYLGFISPITTTDLRFDITCKATDHGSLHCTVLVSGQGTGLCSVKGEYVYR
jgi:3-hydroxyacyl-[acyl-carrier-protein] dehydratase